MHERCRSGLGTFGHAVTVDGPEQATNVLPVPGSYAQARGLCWLRATGCADRAAGSGSPVIGNKFVAVFRHAALNPCQNRYRINRYSISAESICAIALIASS